MTDSKKEDLEGITLSVYLYVVKKGKPVGPRDVMKGVNLSSPSVAYRHLQKLEDLGYLQKNDYGEYTVPKMWLYSLLFLAILIVELFVLFIHFSIETLEFKVFFLLLTLITGLALAVFTVEGLLQSRRKSKIQTE